MENRGKKIKNYGKEIRKFILYQNNINAIANKLSRAELESCDYQNLLSFRSLKALSKVAQSKNYDLEDMSIEAIEKRTQMLLLTMAVLEIFVDVYKILNLREKLEIINALDASLLKEMRNVKVFDDIVKVLCREANLSIVGDALRFSDLSIYDKVLQIKALDDRDLAFLRRVFEPFEVSLDDDGNKIYQSEYEAYNVEVDEAFMIRQMEKWQDIWKDQPEKCYEDAANFLDQYSVLDVTLKERIFETLKDEEALDTEVMLKKFYQSR